METQKRLIIYDLHRYTGYGILYTHLDDFGQMRIKKNLGEPTITAKIMLVKLCNI